MKQIQIKPKLKIFTCILILILIISNLYLISYSLTLQNSILNRNKDFLSSNEGESLISNQESTASEVPIKAESHVEYKGATMAGKTTINQDWDSEAVSIQKVVTTGYVLENIYDKTIKIIDKSGNQKFYIEVFLLNNGLPCSDSLLKLYFNFDNKWEFIDDDYTNIDGQVKFEFKIPQYLIQQSESNPVEAMYKVVYEVTADRYLEEQAKITFKDYDGPKVEYINIYSRTDDEIHVKTYIKCYKEWWHLWIDDLSYVSVKFYTGNTNQKVLFKEYEYDLSQKNYVGFWVEIWLWNYLKTGSNLWIDVYALDKAGFTDFSEKYNYIIDDDSNPPSISNTDDTSKSILNGGNIYDDFQENYFMKVYGSDSSSWGVKIEYKFGEDGNVVSFPYDYRSSGTSWGTTRTIPRSTWIQHVGETIFWRYRAHDYDSDSGAGTNDYSYTSWSSWIDGGTILDDNVHPPDLDSATSTGTINDANQNDFQLNIKAQDDSGWSADIEYTYENSGITNSVILSTTEIDLTQLTYNIPKNEWINHIGSNILWRYKLKDSDNDRNGDSSALGWSDWINGGKLIDDDIEGPEIHVENIHNAAFDSNYVLFYLNDISGIDEYKFYYKINQSNEILANVDSIPTLDNEPYGQAFKAYIGSNYKIGTEINFRIKAKDADNDRVNDFLNTTYTDSFLIEKFLVNPKIIGLSLSNEKLLPGMLFNVEVDLKNEGIQSTSSGSKIHIFLGEKDNTGDIISPAEEVLDYQINTLDSLNEKTYLIPYSIDYEGFYFITISVEFRDNLKRTYWAYYAEDVDLSVKKLQFYINTNTTHMFPGTLLGATAKFLNWAEKPTLDTSISIDKYQYDNLGTKVFLENLHQDYGIVPAQSEIAFNFNDIYMEPGIYEYSGILNYNTLNGLREILYSKDLQVNHPEVSYSPIAKYGQDYNENPYPNEDFNFGLNILNNADSNNITYIEIGLILGSSNEDILWKKSGNINVEPGEIYTINTPWHKENNIGTFSYDVNITYTDAYGVVRSFIIEPEVQIISVPDIQIQYLDVMGSEEGQNLFPVGDNTNGFPLKTTDGALNKLKFEIKVINTAHISLEFSVTDIALQSLRKDYHYLDTVINIPQDKIEAKSEKTYFPEANVTKSIWFSSTNWIPMIINDIVDYAELIASLVTGGLSEVSKVQKIFFIANLLLDFGTQTFNFLQGTHYYEKYKYEGTATYTWQNGYTGQQLMQFPDTPIKISISQHQFTLYVVSSILEAASSILTLFASMAFVTAAALATNPFTIWAAPIATAIGIALTALEVACDVFKYLCIVWSNNDPIDINYTAMKQSLEQDIETNNSIGILAQNTIENTINIMNTTDHIINNENEYEQNLKNENFSTCADLLKERSELQDQNGLNYIEFSNNLQGIFTEFQNLEYLNYTEATFNEAYQAVNSTGLPSKEVEILKDIGYNDDEIGNLTKTVLKYDNFDAMTNFSNSIHNVTNYLNTYGNLGLDDSINSLNESINIDLTHLNESITKASTQEIKELNNLKSLIEAEINQSAWNLAKGYALDLKALSKKVILETKNQTYNKYLEFSSRIIKYVELMLSLDLELHLKKITAKPGTKKLFYINVLNNDKNPTICNVILQANEMNWFSYNTTIPLASHETKTIPIEIYIPRDYTISPGDYQINISIFRQDDTKIKDEDSFIITVLPFYDFEAIITNTSSSSVYPGGNINYSIFIGNIGNVKTNFTIQFQPSSLITHIKFPLNFTIQLNPGDIYNSSFQLKIEYGWMGIHPTFYNYTIKIQEVSTGRSKSYPQNYLIIPTIHSYYTYLKYDLHELTTYIQNNLSKCFRWKLIYSIYKSISFLTKAYKKYNTSEIIISLRYLSLSKTFLISANTKILHYYKHGLIDKDDYLYLIEDLRESRNIIVFLMSLFTSDGKIYKCTLIINQVYELKDFITDEIGKFGQILLTHQLGLVDKIIENIINRILLPQLMLLLRLHPSFLY
ncbi:MAG: hypothetical protein P8Y70_04190 [Candidatus Lokiarchaeota archaeon]